MLSDGKPNDADRYDGRYGVEDMRQSVAEARLQGIFPFCLTVDLQAPGYLPKVFGPDNYAVLSTPERLPLVLRDWTRRLLARCGAWHDSPRGSGDEVTNEEFKRTHGEAADQLRRSEAAADYECPTLGLAAP